MLTIDELNKIRAKTHDMVAIRHRGENTEKKNKNFGI